MLDSSAAFLMAVFFLHRSLFLSFSYLGGCFADLEGEELEGEIADAAEGEEEELLKRALRGRRGEAACRMRRFGKSIARLVFFFFCVKEEDEEKISLVFFFSLRWPKKESRSTPLLLSVAEPSVSFFQNPRTHVDVSLLDSSTRLSEFSNKGAQR